ncbi:hypothetical protein D3C87_1793570 [compost metagenome]
MALSAKKQQNEVLISFTECDKLLTADKLSLTGFELVTEKGQHIIPVKAMIVNKQIRLSIPNGQYIKKVVYAWKPFTRANLTNEAGLPASTFSIIVN